MSVLEQELGYFNAFRRQWVSEGHSDHWAVVKEKRLIGIFETFADGVEAAYRDAEPPFLVKQIALVDRVERI